ncbi:MAG: DUF333 domain-containing protein [Candidatus Nanoarchaeia archaeon]|nr:DUF333 domain-containing protein [Candidatus Nanoarchaeia archaeon]
MPKKQKKKFRFHVPHYIWIILAIIGLYILWIFLPKTETNYNSSTGMLSPFTQDCINHDGKYQIITNYDGSQSGQCMLGNGTWCSDEQYYGEGCWENQINKQQ